MRTLLAPTLETADALAHTSLSRKQWDNMMQRQQYDGAPAVAAGHPRYFDRDDMVALFVLDHFQGLGVCNRRAGQMASSVRKELLRTNETISFFWVYITRDDKDPFVILPIKAGSDLISHRIPVKSFREIASNCLEGK